MNIGRQIFREIDTQERHKAVYRQLQAEAAGRPESKRVATDWGKIWMSPIESLLYEAMLREGLAPVPQFRIEGYYADFAFPDVLLAVEADGAAFHEGDRRQRDHQRDWILGRAGWTVKRFHGTTIHQKAGNCAYVVRQEVDARRRWAIERARQEAARRQARRDAILRPFRAIARLLRLGSSQEPAPGKIPAQRPSSPPR